MKQNTSPVTASLQRYILVGATLIIVGVVFYLFYRIIEPFLSILFSAFIIAIILYPLYRFIINRFRWNRYLAATLSLILFLLVVILPLSIVIILLFNEIRDAIVFLRTNISDIEQLEQVVYSFIESYGINPQNINLRFEEYMVTAMQFLSQRLGIFITRTGSLITNSIMTMIVAFYLLVDKDALISFIASVSPLNSKDWQKIKRMSVETINGTIKGNLAVILMQGCVGFLGFLIFGIQSPFLLGFIYGIFSLIPNIGAALIWLPSTIYLYITQGILPAAGFLAWCFLTNFIIDQFITPRILGGSANLHPVLMLFAVLGGIQAFGLIGIILGPTIITLFFIALQIYKDLISAKYNELKTK